MYVYVLFQLVRFTPPREMTPPPVKQQEYQSVQSITLTSKPNTSSPVNGYNTRADPVVGQPDKAARVANQKIPEPVYNAPPPVQTVKSSTMLILK